MICLHPTRFYYHLTGSLSHPGVVGRPPMVKQHPATQTHENYVTLSSITKHYATGIIIYISEYENCCTNWFYIVLFELPNKLLYCIVLYLLSYDKYPYEK